MISIYLNVDALDIVCRWFEEGRGGIAIEYDYNMVDCDVVDENGLATALMTFMASKMNGGGLQIKSVWGSIYRLDFVRGLF